MIIEDYAKGFLTQGFVDQIGALARRAGKIVTVDPNPRNDLHWTGVTAVKPNRIEALHVAGFPSADVTRAGRARPHHAPGGPAAAGTLGHRDAAHHAGRTGHAAFPARAASVCGHAVPAGKCSTFPVPGDTAIALFTLALAAGAPAEQAADVANHAGGVVVGKLGTATLTPAELIASFDLPPAVTGR